MSILTISNLEKSFGVDLLFSDVTFSVAEGQKIGLVGRNGSGKTTLLRILMGLESADSGKIALASGRRLGYLKQEAPVHPDNTIWQEIQDVYAPIRALEQKVADAEQALADAHGEEALERAMAEYAVARDEFEAAGGHDSGMDCEFVLKKLGFTEADYEKRVGSCSGGERTRLALAKIVLDRADVLILDEPTNHLDIAATEWLEEFVKGYAGAVILVSHDRTFLDAVTDTIADLENLKLTLYKGNYTHFWQQKQDWYARQQALFEQQQAEVERLEDVIKKNMGGDAVQSKIRHRMQGRIERMEKVERPRTDTDNMVARFDADSAGRVGREVVRLSRVTKAYGGRTLFDGIEALVERNDRVGLVGPNGSGKTTLVKMLLGQEQPTHGDIMLGHNVRLSYFSQHAADSLDLELSVIETLLDRTDFTSTEARNYLARFLFTGDDVFKTVGMLSGGEKNKLALACMIIEPCNLLILDEPTNHLDIASCEVLGQMLAQYKGTLLLVSHDRYLLNATTTKTLAIHGDTHWSYYEGNYAAWRDRQRAGEAPVAPAPQRKAAPPKAPQSAAPEPQKPGQGMNAYELGKARAKSREAVVAAEAAVNTLDSRIADVERALASPVSSVGDMVTLAAEHTRLQDDLHAAMAKWEQAVVYDDALNAV
jgi:ATP-binding cassette subfamily F protein 3